ncbi:hypothetical protein [Brevundimonas sp.]|uniref:hypothetical protein n=1 Tax=Brevundimonas sp. TaxID=1871086 RepID=UPI001DBE4442|nr:hypothetical protein [Brevundimonas sp.]MBA4000943.1 hypothetical protein [Brevundimonas sp.]
MSVFSPSGARRPRWRRLAVRSGVLLIVAGSEAALFLGLSRAGPDAPPIDPPPMVVTLVRPPPPPPTPEPAPEESPAPADAAPPDTAPRVAPPSPPPPPVRPLHQPPPPDVQTVPIAPAPPALPVLTSSQTAGARTAGSGTGGGAGGTGSGAGSGGSGGGCDMVRRLQEALRGDAEVRAAIDAAARQLNASGRAIQVWNGDWLQSGAETGKGLAGVRQAIAMEVAFAPADCRTEPMRGLVLLTLGDGAAASRIALGAPAWRWSDLLEID